MVPLITTEPKVYVSIIKTIPFDSCYALEDTLRNFNSIKFNGYQCYNGAYFCAEILVDFECLDIYEYFKPGNLDYTTFIFEDSSDYIFHI